MSADEFMGYARPTGQPGIRNHVLVVPNVVCSATVAKKIAERTGTKTFYNQFGCGHIGPDYRFMLRSISGLAKNPNVAAALVVGLGCESIPAANMAKEIAKTEKPVEYLDIEEVGGALASVEKGVEVVERLKADVATQRREAFPLADLTLGLECGSSDAISGITANPALGIATDRLVEAGGTAILPEFIEWFGAEQELAERFVDEAEGQRFLNLVAAAGETFRQMGADFSLIMPGNVKGGLSTIEEKAIGNIHKAGSKPIQGLLKYATPPPGKGLWLMVEPGIDIESMTGLAGAGCQICVFTTGRGTPAGNLVMPVIKVTGNPHTYAAQKSDIDLDVAAIMEGGSVEAFGEQIFASIVEVANGEQTLAEEHGFEEIAFWRPPYIANVDPAIKDVFDEYLHGKL